VTTRQFLVVIAALSALTMFMSVYVWRLRGREVAAPRLRLAPKAEHVAAPTSGAMEQVTVYVAYDHPGELRAQSISVPLASGRQQRVEGLLRALLNTYTAKNSPHPLASGADVRDVFLVDPGMAVIDLNSAFVDGQVSGVLPEELTLASMIETLSTNVPDLRRVKFLVDGKERGTLAGHVDLSGFFEVSQIAELAKQLSPQ
jgi:Sporulation and spore germination